MARPVMGRRNKVRVEFSLSAELAAEVYQRAREQNLTLSQTGERLLTRALLGAACTDSSPHAATSVPTGIAETRGRISSYSAIVEDPEAEEVQHVVPE